MDVQYMGKMDNWKGEIISREISIELNRIEWKRIEYSIIE